MTRDFVNPERPWPHLSDLAAVTAAAGFDLVPRLPVYPEYLPLLGGGGGRRAGFRGPENKEGEEEAASQQAARRPLSPPRQQEWIAEGGGQEGGGKGGKLQHRGQLGLLEIAPTGVLGAPLRQGHAEAVLVHHLHTHTQAVVTHTGHTCAHTGHRTGTLTGLGTPSFIAVAPSMFSKVTASPSASSWPSASTSPSSLTDVTAPSFTFSPSRSYTVNASPKSVNAYPNRPWEPVAMKCVPASRHHSLRRTREDSDREFTTTTRL